METPKTIREFKTFFQSIQSSHSLKKKSDYVTKFNLFNNTFTFPWREDQIHIINNVVLNLSKYYVINGIFGCGKTTMLFGMLIRFIISKLYTPSDVMFISFNVCIKNEIKRKLKPYGFKGKVRVSTFDSIVYFICKRLGYKYLDLPNFDGKRRFCYEQCLTGNAVPEENQPKVIFIDEVQDLESNCFFFFKYFFPDSKIIFAGDVFQSIQREPRESLLWHLLHKEDNVEKFYMHITPRVPRNILSSLQKTLSEYYPEFRENISTWRSDNQSSEAVVRWHSLNNYSQCFDEAKGKITEYGEENTMILTFSSAITVRGSLGDVARIRMKLLEDKYNLNKNHKKIEEDKLFLSTANSSKGLERDHVVVFLTFPLELAFSNFSDDIIVNLITVAITRAKKTVDFYVPPYKDKFTKVLKYFDMCPQPTKEKIRDFKSIGEFKFQDYIDMDKGVTEMIKQSIINYDTRLELKEFAKMYETSKCFEGEISAKRPIMLCDEERAFVGVVIEILITSTWSNRWPDISDISTLKNHPMYFHIFKRIDTAYKRYKNYSRKSNINNQSQQFKGVYLYTQLHMAVYNKLFISFPPEALNKLETYWCALKPKILGCKPPHNKLKIQVNCQMPWMTGIADAIFYTNTENSHRDEVHIWEIKASIEMSWKDNALTQAIMYSLMTGKAWSRLTLINPFRNEQATYHFNSRKIMTMRNKVYHSIISWNFNCYLAKKYKSKLENTFNITDYYYGHINYINDECCVCFETKPRVNLKPCDHNLCLCCSEKLRTCPVCRENIISVEHPTPIQLTIVEMLSPTRSLIKFNKFYKTNIKTDKPTKLEKLSRESDEVFKTEHIDDQLKPVFLSSDYTFNFVKFKNYKINNLLNSDIDYSQHFGYTKDKDKNYELDFKDGLTKCMCNIVYMSENYKFV